MQPFPFTDASGRAWHVYDFRLVAGQRRAVPIADWRSEARTFVPVDREAPVLVYAFGFVAYRDDLRPKFLEDELRFAKPLNARTGERMDARVSRAP
jgi:hypothetical protein